MTNQYTHLSIGDLIQLGSTKEVGIILKILPVEPYKLVKIRHDFLNQRTLIAPVDIKVLWEDGSISWCLGEAVFVLSPARII